MSPRVISSGHLEECPRTDRTLAFPDGSVSRSPVGAFNGWRSPLDFRTSFIDASVVVHDNPLVSTVPEKAPNQVGVVMLSSEHCMWARNMREPREVPQ